MADPRGINAYISCPMTVDIAYFKQVKSALEKVLKESSKIQAQCTYWTRGTNYDPSYLYNADIVVVIPPTFNQLGVFQNKLTTFPTGTQKEVITTYKRDEQVMYMAYVTASGDIKFYNVCIDSNLQNFDGIAGTTRNINLELEKLSDQKLSFKLDLNSFTEHKKNQSVTITTERDKMWIKDDSPPVEINVLLLKRRR